ncbi:MAG: twin-arginine translocase TatA/TatE family subunit [Thermodesulfobacteriota bacterium]|nr:MAG: twin-arginine translocase TatA/TatE family subunit [Thermodesulfobacteriota bacterium]
MFGLGTQELLVILVIAFFIFGGKKLPEIGAGLGKGLKAFKSGLKDLENEVDSGKLLDNKSGSSSKTEDNKKV